MPSNSYTPASQQKLTGYPIKMPVRASTGPMLAASDQYRSDTGLFWHVYRVTVDTLHNFMFLIALNSRAILLPNWSRLHKNWNFCVTLTSSEIVFSENEHNTKRHIAFIQILCYQRHGSRNGLAPVWRQAIS